MSDDIRFNRANEKPYGAFSNLYRCGVEFEGRLFPTAEHAYQFGKPSRPVVAEWLMAAPSPKQTTVIPSVLRRRPAKAPPTATEMVDPTTADAPITPKSGEERCIDPALPPEMPLARPKSSAIICGSAPPLAK